MPRYTILEHDYPERHWDFLLEAGEILRTWKLSAPPQPGNEVRAELSFDHRLLYLDYEGPVSGNRGRVRRWDSGLYTWEVDSKERVVIRLEGGRCRGHVVLARQETGAWSFTLKLDE